MTARGGREAPLHDVVPKISRCPKTVDSLHSAPYMNRHLLV